METQGEEEEDYLDDEFCKMWQKDVNRMNILNNASKDIFEAVKWAQEEHMELQIHIADLKQCEH